MGIANTSSAGRDSRAGLILTGVLVVAAWQIATGSRLTLLHLVGLLLVVAVGSNYALFFDYLREREARLACGQCGALIGNEHKESMNSRGTFLAPGQRVEGFSLTQKGPPRHGWLHVEGTNGTVVGDPPDADAATWFDLGAWVEKVTLEYIAALASEQGGQPFRVEAIRPIQMSTRDAMTLVPPGTGWTRPTVARASLTPRAASRTATTMPPASV